MFLPLSIVPQVTEDSGHGTRGCKGQEKTKTAKDKQNQVKSCGNAANMAKCCILRLSQIWKKVWKKWKWLSFFEDERSFARLSEHSCHEPRLVNFDTCWKYNTIYNGIKIVVLKDKTLGNFFQFFSNFFQTLWKFPNSLENNWKKIVLLSSSEPPRKVCTNWHEHSLCTLCAIVHEEIRQCIPKDSYPDLVVNSWLEGQTLH